MKKQARQTFEHLLEKELEENPTEAKKKAGKMLKMMQSASSMIPGDYSDNAEKAFEEVKEADETTQEGRDKIREEVRGFMEGYL